MRNQIVVALAFTLLMAAVPASAQVTRFAPTLRPGQHLDISTIDGDVTVSQGEGRTAEIVATKTVRKGDGSRVKAVMESTADGSIEVTLPAGIAVSIKGSTVDGNFSTDFPLTVRGKWGPRSNEGTIGSGGTRTLRLGSVDGDITLRRR